MGMQRGSCSCVAPEVQGSSPECAVLILLAPSTAALPSLHPPGSNAARSTWEVEVDGGFSFLQKRDKRLFLYIYENETFVFF